MKFIDDSQAEEFSFEVNVISLVDILFLLVIFFAVTTTFSDEHGISVDLPTASAGALVREEHPLTVSLSSDSAIFLDSKPTKIEALGDLLRAHQASAAVKSIVIRADKKVSHGTVVAVMEAARTAGIEDIAFATSQSVQ